MINQHTATLGLLICLLATLSTTALAQDRVVSVGGDVTEIIYALGEGDRIVASDSTSVYPPEAEQTPKVGYVRNLSAEGVLSVEPDLILISGAAGPPPALELLEASGVPIISMETAYTIEAIIDKTQRVAEALGATAAGEVLVQQIEQDWAQAQSVLAEAEPMTMLFFATPPDGSPLAAGTDTAAQGIIDLLNGTNVFDSYTGYKPLSMEAAVAANPDIILVMHHHADRVGGMDSVKSHPALSLSPAAMEDQIYPVDQVTVMQFGPRTPAAVGQLAEEIQQGQANVNER